MRRRVRRGLLVLFALVAVPQRWSFRLLGAAFAWSARERRWLLIVARHAVLAWWFAVSYAGGAGTASGPWLLMASPTGPFKDQAQCESVKASLTTPNDPRIGNVRLTACWDAGPTQVIIQFVPYYQ